MNFNYLAVSYKNAIIASKVSTFFLFLSLFFSSRYKKKKYKCIISANISRSGFNKNNITKYITLKTKRE